MKELLNHAAAAAVLLVLFLLAQRTGRKRLMAALLAGCCLASCSKSSFEDSIPPVVVESKATVKLYSTNVGVSVKIVNAEVNGKPYGRIMYSASAPKCNDAGFKAVELLPGSYIVDILDPNNPNASRQVTISVAKEFTTCQFFNVK